MNVYNYIIDTYIDNYPRNDVKESLFEQESYSKFFALKILNDFDKYENKIIYLENLLDELGEFMTRENGVTFSIGYDVASDILSYLYGEVKDEQI